MNPAWIQTALAIVLSLTAPLYLQGCGGDGKKEAASHHETGHDHDHDHHHDHDHGHSHTAPHGGTLLAIGDHFAHVELVLDSPTGRLTAYVLDGEGSGPVRLSMKAIPMTLTVTEGPSKESFAINLDAVANPLTGETADNTSEYAYTGDKLKGVSRFEGTILNLEIKGQTVKDTAFKFPEGNE